MIEYLNLDWIVCGGEGIWGEVWGGCGGNL